MVVTPTARDCILYGNMCCATIAYLKLLQRRALLSGGGWGEGEGMKRNTPTGFPVKTPLKLNVEAKNSDIAKTQEQYLWANLEVELFACLISRGALWPMTGIAH